MDLSSFRELLDVQRGVVTRRPVLAGGASDNDLRRWVRRRELARVHTGVYVDHTGSLTWANRAWAAVLFHWPAALAHRSALDRAGNPVRVAIDASRTASDAPPGRRRPSWSPTPVAAGARTSPAERQVAERTVDGLVYRDVRYRRFGVVVEPDGRIGHETGHDRWDDQDRTSSLPRRTCSPCGSGGGTPR